jgi:hypothetical protein
VFLEEVLAQTGKANISEVWPNLKSCLHGGVGFEPYRSLFKKYIPSEKVVYREIYNASEGYFAIQNEKDIDGMLLLCDHEIYYEFVLLSDLEKGNYQTLQLSEVSVGTEYALVISNTSGLYRYLIGDTIKFVSTLPYKLKVTGRVNQQLNIFGEELSIDNVELALARACLDESCSITNFTVAPVFMSANKHGAHEWLIEFNKAPVNLNNFACTLDSHLKAINSDYEAKRSYDMVLRQPLVVSAPTGVFESWLRQQKKLGNQNKIPRLQTDRMMIEALKSLFAQA